MIKSEQEGTSGVLHRGEGGFDLSEVLSLCTDFCVFFFYIRWIGKRQILNAWKEGRKEFFTIRCGYFLIIFVFSLGS